MLPAFVGSMDPFECRCTPALRYHGLTATDSAILAEHLRLLPPEPRRLWTCVPCGSCPAGLAGATPTDPTCPKASRYFKRLDAVLQSRGGHMLAEVKPSASYRALGQILTYRHLTRQQWPELAHAAAAIMTDAADPDIIDLAHSLGVMVLQLPDHVYVPRQSPG